MENSNLEELTDELFVAEVKRRREGPARVSPGELRRLREAFAEAAISLREISDRMAVQERAVSDSVMEAYGLTPDEVELVWRTARLVRHWQPQMTRVRTRPSSARSAGQRSRCADALPTFTMADLRITGECVFDKSATGRRGIGSAAQVSARCCSR